MQQTEKEKLKYKSTSCTKQRMGRRQPICFHILIGQRPMFPLCPWAGSQCIADSTQPVRKTQNETNTQTGVKRISRKITQTYQIGNKTWLVHKRICLDHFTPPTIDNQSWCK